MFLSIICLKGEQKMDSYYDYLEESTNVRKKQH